MLLDSVVRTSAAVTATSGRLAKIDHIARLLLDVPPAEIPVAVSFLSGDLTQRQIGVGYAALSDLMGGFGPDAWSTSAAVGQPADAAQLTLAETDQALGQIGALAGQGSQAERRRLLALLLSRATAAEREFLVRLLAGDLRQGALDGVMTDAIARAAGVAGADVRRAHQLSGSLPTTAAAALGADGDPHAATAALRAVSLEVGRPIRPMLAASAPNLAAALERMARTAANPAFADHEPALAAASTSAADSSAVADPRAAADLGPGTPSAIEWKVDGIRVQVHRGPDGVRVFSRTLDDITHRVPEIAEAANSLSVTDAVLDGEAVALRPDGRPHPFQVTAARAASQAGPDGAPGQVPLSLFLFDVLHLDGTDLIDAPAHQRFSRLAAVAPANLVIPRLITADLEAAQQFFGTAVDRGHEGVIVKSLGAPYGVGRRGSEWIKVKPRHTLDLLVLGAEWGHGRRQGWLSNLHLGARDPATGRPVMLGKTFKGLTDALLTWQTERLLELAEAGGPDGREPGRRVVRVRPELVVEIAFDGVQASTRYPGGVTLRFARVLRYRPDKDPAEADTIDTVRGLWTGDDLDADSPD